MKKSETAILMGLILSIVLTGVSSFARDCSSLRDEVLRLHIMANSDREEDQALKLKVRDRVLRETGELFSSAKNLSEAHTLAEQNLELIKAAAQDELKRQGSGYTADVSIQRMFFETRLYDNFTLPAGMYDAVRVTIGSGQGKNWWCVMFPPLCLGSAVDEEELDKVLSDPSLIQGTQKYKAKFFIVELFERLINKQKV